MPDKPLWYGRLDAIIGELESLTWPWVDRQIVQDVLGVGRRRAQQILQPCVVRQLGSSGLADREQFISHLRRLAAGEQAYYELRRREKLAAALETLRRTRLEQPAVLIEAPVSTVNQEIQNLPSGVTIAPGQIRISFSATSEALEKLLALAMAIGNDLDGFERIANPRESVELSSTVDKHASVSSYRAVE